MSGASTRAARWTGIAMLVVAAALASGADEEKFKAAFKLHGVDATALKGLDVHRTVLVEEERTRAHVDWSNRTIVTLGRALQAGRRPVDALMARRAAGVIALRNALAMSAGVRISRNGRVGGLRSGAVTIQGILKDYEITRERSQERNGRIYWIAEVHVPMFGVKSVAAGVYEEHVVSHRQRVAARKRAAWVEPAKDDEAEGDVLVIDARGSDFTPCFYPLVVSETGEVLIDVETVSKDVAVGRGTCAYARTKLTYEKLEIRPADGAAPATTQLHPAPRRYTVRALRAGKEDKTTLVLSDEDAHKLLADGHLSALVQSGRIVVIVDKVPPKKAPADQTVRSKQVAAPIF
jgi:hypothetical protein